MIFKKYTGIKFRKKKKCKQNSSVFKPNLLLKFKYFKNMASMKLTLMNNALDLYENNPIYKTIIF